MTGSNHRMHHYSANAACINKTLLQPNAVTSRYVIEPGIALPGRDRSGRLAARCSFRNHLFSNLLQ